VDGFPHPVKELTSEHSAQGLDPKQEVFACVNPAAVIEGQSTGRDKTMEMKMVLESLIPGVQHSDDSKGSLKMCLAKLKQCFADGFKQKS